MEKDQVACRQDASDERDQGKRKETSQGQRKIVDQQEKIDMGDIVLDTTRICLEYRLDPNDHVIDQKVDY